MIFVIWILIKVSHKKLRTKDVEILTFHTHIALYYVREIPIQSTHLHTYLLHIHSHTQIHFGCLVVTYVYVFFKCKNKCGIPFLVSSYKPHNYSGNIMIIESYNYFSRRQQVHESSSLESFVYLKRDRNITHYLVELDNWCFFVCDARCQRMFRWPFEVVSSHVAHF